MKSTTTTTSIARTALSCALAAALTMGGAGIALAAPVATAAPTVARAEQSACIGAKAAVKVALKHAGVRQRDCRDIDCELDVDDYGPVHYDVEFKVGQQEYDYDIDAVSGKVLSWHVEYDD